MKEKRENIENEAEESSVNLDENITRREFMEILSQVSDNINQISEYLMQDVNAMYSQHVFPLQMRCAVYEDILVEEGIFDIDDIEKRIEAHVNELKQKAEEEIKRQKEEGSKSDNND